MSATDPQRRNGDSNEAPRLQLPAFRSLFPAVDRQVYVNVCSSAVMSKPACAAANGVNDAVAAGVFTKEDAEPVLTRTRHRFAELIGAANGDEIALVKNVSEGLNAVAQAISWQPGDNVVVSTALEHPNNVYPWLALRRRGIELRNVPPRNNAIDAPALASAIDDRTRIVTASSVSFTPGFRTDLATIGRAARAHNAFFLVDAVQSCGVLKIEVEPNCIDGLVTSTTKHLLGAHGLGFLYVRSAWLPRLTPAYISRYSVERASGHESEIEGDDYTFAAGAHRFEIGNYNWPAIAAADVSLGHLLDLGIETIEARAIELADRLRAGLLELKLSVSEPADPTMRSHIVTIGRLGEGGAYETANPALNRLAEALRVNRTVFTVRRGLLRFSLHAFNNEDDVDRLMAVTRRTLDEEPVQAAPVASGGRLFSPPGS